MPIINVGDNDNGRWKRKGKNTKTERRKGVAKVIMKVWELNDFLARLSLICKASLIFKSNLESALSSRSFYLILPIK